MDWPLSREEKKSRLLRLYDQEQQVLTDSQQKEQFRVKVLREELRAAHCGGDMPGLSPCHRSFDELPHASSGRRSSDLVPAPQAETRLRVNRSIADKTGGYHGEADRVGRSPRGENTEGSGEGALEGLNAALEAVGAGFAALGSLFFVQQPWDDSDSDRGDHKSKQRARSHSIHRRRDVAPAQPALKKRSSRRNSRAEPLQVCFRASLESDCEHIKSKMREPSRERSHKTFTRRVSDQEPMGEPEPASPNASPRHDYVDGSEVEFAISPTCPTQSDNSYSIQDIEQHREDGHRDRRMTKAFIRTECCVPSDVQKIGICFTKMPPEPLVARRIIPGSWAELQGISSGDIVVSIAGMPCETLTASDFMSLMQARPLKLIVEQPRLLGEAFEVDC